MKTNRSIQFKAAFLLVIFALNTVVGFACSMGLDMGFNTPHHGKDAKGSVHIHKDGKKHIHKPVAGKQKHPHQAEKATASKKDDCCKDKVVKLQNADKRLNDTQTAINPPGYAAVVSSFFHQSLFNAVEGYAQKYTACQFHPPPRDIRIAIQSFQI